MKKFIYGCKPYRYMFTICGKKVRVTDRFYRVAAKCNGPVKVWCKEHNHYEEVI